MTPERFERIKALHAEFEAMGMQCADWGVMAHEHRAHLIEAYEEAADGYQRWHQEFLDAKYPSMLPMRVDLEKALTFAAAWLPALDDIEMPSAEVRKILIAAKDRSQADGEADGR